MLLDIVTYPAPLLAISSEPVCEITGEIRALAADMFETMYASRGVGLAAPQVGRPLRILVMDAGQKDKQPAPRVFVNPVLVLLGDEIVSEQEGCLSVPLNYRADVLRSSSVFLRARDLDGNDIAQELSGFSAIVLQHEADHLDGLLFIDHISRLRRTLYDSKVKKWLTSKNDA
ncbi:MAG: peptide deformylase [Desulfovibrio sp.]|jgi:peptide deformylase|nr:peptide deformylase [Desulfovibrio sp.]